MGTNSELKELYQQNQRKQWATEDWVAQQTRQHGGGGGGRGGGCFPGHTEVLTPSGLVPISAISAGDWVTSLDPETRRTVARRVLARRVYRSGRLWEVRLRDCEVAVVVTKRHSFLTSRGWVKAGALQVGDSLVRADRAVAVVEWVRDTGQSHQVYNLITENEHTFFAGGFAVHNFTRCRQLRVHAYALRTWLSQLIGPAAATTDRTPAHRS